MSAKLGCGRKVFAANYDRGGDDCSREPEGWGRESYLSW